MPKYSKPHLGRNYYPDYSGASHRWCAVRGTDCRPVLLRYDAARRAEANVDGLFCEGVTADDRAAVTARAILTIVATSRSHVEALRAIAVYLRDEFADERRQTMADRGLADA